MRTESRSPAIGLLTGALFVTHLAVAAARRQARGSLTGSGRRHRRDRLRASPETRSSSSTTSFALALLGRAIVGFGSGAGFVAGLDLVRAGGGGPVLQGVYGGATMAGGGLALMVVPSLTDGERLESAVLERRDPRAGRRSFRRSRPPASPASATSEVGVLRDPGLIPLGVLQAATFGLAVIAGNWAVPLLEHQGVSPTAAGLAAGLILSAGIVTRPTGGTLAGTAYARIAMVSALLGVAVGRRAARARRPVLALGRRIARDRARSRAPVRDHLRRGSADGDRTHLPPPSRSSTACGVLTILVGTPLAGIAFLLPGDGRLAFAAIAALSLSALIALRKADF